MELEERTAIREALANRQEELTPAVLSVMDEMLRNLRSDGREALAERMATLRELSTEYAGESLEDDES